MRRFYAAAAFVLAAVLAAGTANAAGLNDQLPPVADDSGEYWTGFWAGIAAGAQTGNTELEAGGFEFDGLGSDGVTGCLRAGYDHQSGRFVIGAWGEGCLSTAESSIGFGGDDVEITEDYSAGVGARIGIAAWRHTLVYAKGGYRWSRINMGDLDLDDETYGGIVAGGGVETFIGERTVLGVDADHTFYSDKDIEGISTDRGETRGMVSVGFRF